MFKARRPNLTIRSRDFEANVIVRPTVCIAALILSSQSIRYRCQTMIFHAGKVSTRFFT